MKLRGLFALLAIAAGSATAGVISSTSANFSGTTGAVNGSVSQFDPTLGTLTGVTVHITNIHNGQQVEVSNSNSGPYTDAYATFQYKANMSIGGFSQAGLLDANGGAGFNWFCQFNSGLEHSTCDAVSGLHTDTYTVPVNWTLPGGNYSSFIGTGNVSFQMMLLATFTVDTANSHPSNAFAQWVTDTMSGTVTIDYAYDPAVARTPEPATISMLGLGLAGVLARVIQRRRSRD